MELVHLSPPRLASQKHPTSATQLLGHDTRLGDSFSAEEAGLAGPQRGHTSLNRINLTGVGIDLDAQVEDRN
jgi:hypothetical protein